MQLYKQTSEVSRFNAGASPPGFIAFVSVGNGNHWYHCRRSSLIADSHGYRFPTKRGDTNWYRPPQIRYGAHVASQRCTILRSGKAIILCRNTQLMATPKTQIVLDMGYTLAYPARRLNPGSVQTAARPETQAISAQTAARPGRIHPLLRRSGSIPDSGRSPG